MVQEGRQTQARERQSIWSVPGHLWPWYIVIFVHQYFLFLGLTVWHEVAVRGGSGALEITLNVQKGMTASILNMAASTYIILEGVMLAQWLKERDRRKQEESFERGRRAGQDQWRDWFERMQTAQREGRPFDEPPPGQRKPGSGE